MRSASVLLRSNLLPLAVAVTFMGTISPGVASAQPALDPASACSALASVQISPTQIGLPTSGARVVDATFLPASGSGSTAKPEYCRVLVAIGPVDAQAQPINVKVNLPSAWNGKALQMGGGGFDGFLVTADGAGPGANGQPSPLSLGYATFGSDGGHHVANPFDVEGQVAAFMNDEVLANYAGDQLKKTHDVALALIGLRFGKAPRRMYFAGGSAGGREALVVTQKWGRDYDGAIAYYPAGGGVPMILAYGRDSRALAAPGAYPGPAKQALLHRAVVAACDADDGALDGIVSHPSSCRFDVRSLRCPEGKEGGDTCLSDPQIAALEVMRSDLKLSTPLPSGETGVAGYNVFEGVDLTQRISGLGAAAPSAKPVGPAQPVFDKFYDIFVRGWLMRDKNADSLAFDPANPGPFSARLAAMSRLVQAWQADLSTFSQRGGKLIIVHGDDDALVPVGWSEAYYDRVVRKMGTAAADRFIRFYTVPGYGHGTGSFMVDWDSLSALDAWVEKGSPPVEPFATDLNPGGHGRTRPLCRYPAWPRYRGSGDINSAVSFSCVGP
jgi:feruloyl esterase